MPDRPTDDDGTDNKGMDGTGDALRSAYEKTVKEPVPDELLDLLNKLD